ncbi:GTP-binding protein, partial [Hortaea werneckii]
DEYTILNSKHFIGIHGYMIVYSVASKQSFEMCRIIRDKILNHLGADTVPIMIVGNKSDLRPEQRQVQTPDGKKLAEELGCGFVEASARYNENVNKAFEGMVGEIEKGQEAGQPKEGNTKCAVIEELWAWMAVAVSWVTSASYGVYCAFEARERALPRGNWMQDPRAARDALREEAETDEQRDDDNSHAMSHTRQNEEQQQQQQQQQQQWLWYGDSG